MSINPPSLDEHLSNGSLSIKEKLNNLQRSLHDLSNRYAKPNPDESTNSMNNEMNVSSFDQRTKSHLTFGSNLTSTPSRPNYSLNQRNQMNNNSQRTFTNPLQSLTTNQLDFSSREPPSNVNATTTTTTTPTAPITTTNTSTDNKVNRRWGTNDRTPSDGSLNTNNTTVPYVRRRSGAGVNETSSSTTTTMATATTTSTPLVSVTTSLPSVTSPPTATTNVTVTSSSADDSLGGKRRSNVPPSRDEEAEAQRKHRSAVARRERRSTQSVTQEDIKAAEQQIKNRPSNADLSLSPTPSMSTTTTTTPTMGTTMTDSSNVTLANNKIGAPSTPSTVAEHDIETERLQRVIEEKKDKARRSSGGNEDIIETTVDPSSIGSRRIRSRFATSNETEKDPIPSITANDSLNLGLTSSFDSQQQQTRRRTNRVHNQRKNTGRIIWNDETKEVEIRDDSNDLTNKSAYVEESHRSDDQKLQENAQQLTSNSVLLGSRGLISRFENPLTTTTTTVATKDSSSPTSPTSRTNRSQSQDPTRKSLTISNSLPPATATTTTTTTTSSNPNTFINGMASSTPFALKKDSKENSSTNNDNSATKRLYDDSKRKIDELTQKVDRLERDILERDQMIEKLKTSQYIESSLDKREKRAYERKISELEEELKKLDSIKADNTRLKEENAALIRVISKLSK